jgi:maleylpyruvate isomerase
MIVGMTQSDVLTPEGRTAVLAQLDEATERLLRTAGSLGEPDLREASLLPGWTRAHVLAHVARNAEALANLLRGARTGTPAAAYASQEARDSAIEEGARLPHSVLLPELIDSAGLFRAEAFAVPETAWSTTVGVLSGAEFPAAETLVRRLVEVELHHVDLGAGYGWRDWPESFTQLDLGEPMRSQRADRMAW